MIFSIRPVTGPPFRPTGIRSGEKLREQSFTGLPHRLAASAGSLRAGKPVFLPIIVFNRVILCLFSPFVKGLNPPFSFFKKKTGRSRSKRKSVVVPPRSGGVQIGVTSAAVPLIRLWLWHSIGSSSGCESFSFRATRALPGWCRGWYAGGPVSRPTSKWKPSSTWGCGSKGVIRV